MRLNQAASLFFQARLDDVRQLTEYTDLVLAVLVILLALINLLRR
jgi:hypothetical protein